MIDLEDRVNKLEDKQKGSCLDAVAMLGIYVIAALAVYCLGKEIKQLRDRIEALEQKEVINAER